MLDIYSDNDYAVTLHNTFVVMHHRAKLTSDQVRAMRKDHIPYIVGYDTLAKKYGCGVSTCRDICTYRTRKNVK